jgi:hypothetical protein
MTAPIVGKSQPPGLDMRTSRDGGKSSHQSRGRPICDEFGRAGLERAGVAGLISGQSCATPVAGIFFVAIGKALMLVMQILGGIFVLLFIAAAMTGIEGTEHN